ncbi:MAG: oligoribonuclease [Candidatus Nanopelagicales bacterium]|nr:oligoribonuclease [Candidatus Nanopelagicales bacterium]
MPDQPDASAPANAEAHASAANERIVWLDCEMTGLDPNTDALVEIACVVTEPDLTPLDEGITVVIKPPDGPLRSMDDVVVGMHTESGLLEEIPNGTTLAEATRLVMSYVTERVPGPRRAPLAGSSVYVDRGFLAKYMPELDQYLHYRLIDVSSIKELVKRWHPDIYHKAPEKTGNHRALGDTLDSIAELAYYREKVMTPPAPTDG